MRTSVWGSLTDGRPGQDPQKECSEAPIRLMLIQSAHLKGAFWTVGRAPGHNSEQNRGLMVHIPIGSGWGLQF